MSYPSDRHPSELLPWLANGTLEGEERAAVEAHLADCDTCRSELQLLRELRETIRAEPLADAGDLGLQRLLQAVRKERKAQSARPRWLIPAAIAASLVIAVQAVMLLQPGPQAPVYAPLSGPSAGRGVLQVEFMPEAREADLRNLLRDAGARIVDGPSAVGLYRLAVASGRDPQQVLERLRSHKTLVRHVALER
jgi:anti-sigma factor RsiW